MVIYRLDYVLAEKVDGKTDGDPVLADWPDAHAFFELDESFQYSSKEIAGYVADYWRATGISSSEWFCSRREAVVRRLELFKAGKLHGRKNDHSIAAVDMPTRKREIVTWLNERRIK